MRRYKVTCKATEDSTGWATYFDTNKEAKAFAKTYTGFSAKVTTVEVEFHHSAKTKGYWARSCRRRTTYVGRFGVGYIEHLYNADTKEYHHHSNKYHTIEYFIEVTK